MRIISGLLAGRTFKSPSSHKTHPMSERVKGGLFNSLGDIEGLTVLDAFAGSGALSFEAVSRGASFVTAVDIGKQAVKVIKEGINTLGIQQKMKIIQANCSSWSDNNSETTFDIVLAAPPYDKLQLKLLQKLTRHVIKDGLYVLDWPGKLIAPEFIDLNLLKQNNYGDSQLVFFRKNS